MVWSLSHVEHLLPLLPQQLPNLLLLLSSSIFKASFDSIEPTQIIQGNLLILRSVKVGLGGPVG